MSEPWASPSASVQKWSVRGVGLGPAQAQLATGEAGGQQVINCGLQILFTGEDADSLANWGLEANQ